MTEQKADAHAEGAHSEKSNKSGWLSAHTFNAVTGFVRGRFGGYWRSALPQPLESGNETPVQARLSDEKIFTRLDNIGRHLGEIIEVNWDEAEDLKEEITKEYLKIGPYNDLGRIDTEILLTESGTNVKMPRNDTTRRVEYKCPTIAREKIIINTQEFNDLTEIGNFLRDHSAVIDFTALKERLAVWIERDLKIKSIAKKIRESNTIADAVNAIKYPSNRILFEYTPLEVEPVTLLNFGGGKAIGPKATFDSGKDKPLVGKKQLNTIAEVYSFAQTNNADFRRFFIDDIENKEILVEWVEKELGLKALAKKISKMTTVDEFLGFFPHDRPLDYREPEYVEQLTFFGYKKNVDDIKNILTYYGGQITSTTAPDFGEEIQTRKNQLIGKEEGSLTKLIRVLMIIGKNEKSFYRQLSEMRKHTAVLNDLRNTMMRENWTKQRVHFRHTYMMTKMYHIYKERSDDIVFFKDVDIHSNFKRDEETDFGLDENGMPLEVYEHNGEWYVLTDHWFYNISQNEWQMKKIVEKKGEEKTIKIFQGRADGSKAWNSRLGLTLENKYNHGLGRKVAKEFVEPLDLIEATTYVCTNWDAYRDDFRDGRFHPHSKTYYDYVLAANSYNPVTKNIKGIWHILFGVVVPVNTITVGRGKMVQWNSDPWKRMPVHGDVLGINLDSRLPFDEKRVTRDFELEYLNSAGNIQHMKVDDKNKPYVRKPAHMCPAFDRIAVQIKGKDEEEADGHGHGGGFLSKIKSLFGSKHGEEPHAITSTHKDLNVVDKGGYEENWVHWGRMYYYEGAGCINNLSENPDPCTSTRGTAKYVIDRVIRETSSKEEARKILKGHLYDFGVRKQGIELIDDPFGGAEEHLLRFGKYKEKYKTYRPG